jgi:ribosome recycling factor
MLRIFFRPTVEARTSLYTSAQRKAEDARVQIRKHHAASLKKGKFEKHSIELEEVCPSSSFVVFPAFLTPRSVPETYGQAH